MTIADRARQLRHDRNSFVHATVVRAQHPTSAQAGDEAILLPDGTIEGFVGGQCAQSSVRKAALGVLQTGQSVLLRPLPGCPRCVRGGQPVFVRRCPGNLSGTANSVAVGADLR